MGCLRMPHVNEICDKIMGKKAIFAYNIGEFLWLNGGTERLLTASYFAVRFIKRSVSL